MKNMFGSISHRTDLVFPAKNID